MLHEILDELVAQAIHKGWSVISLKGGLIIYITVENFSLLQLTLRREHLPPSILEWKTVLKNWPWPVNATPREIGNNLVADFVIHPKYTQPSLLPLDYVGQLF